VALTHKQRRFAELYRGKGTGIDAARRAGYGGDKQTLKVTASRLLREPEVLAEMARVQDAAEGTAPASELEEVQELAASRPPELSARHEAFVAAYVGEAAGNATEAARIAGYKSSGKRLRDRAAAVLAREDVQRALAVARAKTRAAAVADRREIEERFTAILRGQEGATPTQMIRAGESLCRMRGYWHTLGNSLPDLPIPDNSSGAAIVVWRGNGRGPPPE